jgi:membrane-bound lytic murein transglycosylase MltF
VAFLVGVAFTPAETQQPAPAPSRAITPDTALVTHPWIGDLDGMLKRHMIRVLTPYSKTHYFIDKGVQRGVTYDALKLFEDELNAKFKTGTIRVHVVFVPTSRDKLKEAREASP